MITLAPGAYTGIVRGANGGTGIALVETYDLDPSADSRLGNVSTRGLVMNGDNVLIGGFIVGGSDSSTVIVRAIGPSLAQAGLSHPLVDPTLALYNGSGTIVSANDNWRSGQPSEIEGYGLAPSSDYESALLGHAPAGSLTAIVRSVTGESGVGLVEVYKVQR